MRVRDWPIHPLFFALFPPLSLFANNASLIPLSDLVRPVALVLAGVAVLWAGLWATLRSRSRAAVATSIATLAFFSYGPLKVALGVDEIVPWEWSSLFNPGWLLGWLVVIALAVRGTPKDRSPRGYALVGAILVSMPMTTVAGAYLRQQRSAGPEASRVIGPAPDIFFIVLDGYGRSDALRRSLGFSDEALTDGLRSRGFVIADDARANYAQTELSLASSLNLDYLPRVIESLPNDNNRDPLVKRIDQNELSRRLRSRGYQYVAVTTGFPPFQFRSSDLRLAEPTETSIYEAELLKWTPIGIPRHVMLSQYHVRRTQLKAAFSHLGRLGERGAAPRFVLAHVLAPHPPFVFGPNEEPVRPSGPYRLVDGSHFMENGGSREEYAKGYAGQATTIGRMVLRTVDEILRRSKTPPIIVVQGDHGSKMGHDQERLDRTDVGEVFPILSAAFVPEGMKPRFTGRTSPVNTWRTVLREQFGEDLPPLPDQSYFSGWSTPYEFTDVTLEVDKFSPRKG